MAESTLALTRADLQTEVGRFLGYGSGDTTIGDAEWTDRQTRRIAEAIRGGLRKFYFAPGVDWSFLKPVASVTLASGASTVMMPDDFGEPEGDVVIATLANHECKVPIVGYGPVYNAHAHNASGSGQPAMVCFESIKGSTASEGQRKRMYVYPTANQEYTLQVRYYLLPNAVSEQRPFHYGGAAHSETILYACKSAAELAEDIAPGAMTAEFMRLLEASIAWDRKATQQVFGFNTDKSDRRYLPRRGGYTVTFDGLVPGA